MPLGNEIHTQRERATLKMFERNQFFSSTFSSLSFCSVPFHSHLLLNCSSAIYTRDGAVIYVGNSQSQNLHAHLIRSSIFDAFIVCNRFFHTLEMCSYRIEHDSKLHSSISTSHAVTQSDKNMNFYQTSIEQKT